MLVFTSIACAAGMGFCTVCSGAAGDADAPPHRFHQSQGVFFDYIQNLVPSHLYYSSAYCQKPDAPTMGEKRAGAGRDILFDLDADRACKRTL